MLTTTIPMLSERGAGDDAGQGGLGADLLVGDTGADTLDGNDGDDTIWGDAEDALAYGVASDFFNGGAGDDVLHVGVGDHASSGDRADEFAVHDIAAGGPVAQIMDYERDDDALVLLYDASHHTDPQITVLVDESSPDATVMLDGVPVAQVIGGAGCGPRTWYCKRRKRGWPAWGFTPHTPWDICIEMKSD